jgi:hypothetical protein
VFVGAREAIFDNKLRRGVVELAMACEILVKESFFSGNISALVAIGDLEDRGRVQLRVLDLIDRVSLEVFGQSFRVRFSEEFNHVDYLFRCRNKVIHQGKLFYRNNDKEEIPDQETLKSWWKSVRKLEIWIQGLDAISRQENLEVSN